MSSPSYDPRYFEPLSAVEERHFWFRARNRAIETLARDIAEGWNSPPRILEVGCGTGNVLRVLLKLRAEGTVVGMDLFHEGLRQARVRTGCRLVQADVRALPFGSSFDLIGAFDILEHLPDDVEVLGLLRTLLKPGGSLLFTVPAEPGLWSYCDEGAHHYRRYTRSSLKLKLMNAGYTVDYLSNYMAFIFPLLWFTRWLIANHHRRVPMTFEEKQAKALSELRIVPVINGLLTLVLSQEARLLGRRIHLPLGTSLVGIARRADESRRA